jgi:inner membrane protein
MIRSPLLVRALALLAVAAAILVPLRLIAGKVAERQARAAQVLMAFAAETRGEQAIAGPFLALTCEQAWNEERQVMRAGKAETVTERRTGECPTVFIAPKVLRVEASIPVETLRRGIYPIRAFRAETRVQGQVEWPAEPESSETHRRRWKDAYLVTRIGDRRGLRSVASGQSSNLLATSTVRAIDEFSVRESYGPIRPPGTLTDFAYDYVLAGTGSFHVLPIGDETQVRLSSNWPHPSFASGNSPETRSIGAEGFEAKWRVTSVSTGGSAAWVGDIASGKMMHQPIFGAGVVMHDPVDVYALSFRATEYGFLFVLFTFAALALAEVTAGVRLHPIQYALVGSALAVFFLLLLALSEHVPFGAAYAIAAAACVALLTFYLRHPLRTKSRTALFFALFAGLYGSLFVLLRLEDHALLVGSGLVFAALAATMVLTRKVDWTALGISLAPPAAARESGAPSAAS